MLNQEGVEMKYLIAIKGWGKRKNEVFSFPDRESRSAFLKAIKELGPVEYALSSMK